MSDLYNLEKLKKRLEEYRIEGEKEMYVFRGNIKYIISSSIFFIVTAFIALYPFYKVMKGLEKLSHFKIFLSILLLVYVIISFTLLFKYKVVIEENIVTMGKIKVDMDKIVSATVKIDRISFSRYDRCLEIITEDKKRIKCRLNMGNMLLFLKLIQNSTGNKLKFKI